MRFIDGRQKHMIHANALHLVQQAKQNGLFIPKWFYSCNKGPYFSHKLWYQIHCVGNTNSLLSLMFPTSNHWSVGKLLRKCGTYFPILFPMSSGICGGNVELNSMFYCPCRVEFVVGMWNLLPHLGLNPRSIPPWNMIISKEIWSPYKIIQGFLRHHWETF